MRMTVEEIMQSAAEVGAMQAVLKEQTMIYQREDKISNAEFLGLQHDVFFHLPYVVWSQISQYIFAFKTEASALYDSCGGDHKAFGHLPNDPAQFTMGELWGAYRDHFTGETKQLREEIQKLLEANKELTLS